MVELTSVRQAPSKDASFRTPLTRRPIVWADPERDQLSRGDALRANGERRDACAEGTHPDKKDHERRGESGGSHQQRVVPRTHRFGRE